MTNQRFSQLHRNTKKPAYACIGKQIKNCHVLTHRSLAATIYDRVVWDIKLPLKHALRAQVWGLDR